MEKSNNYRITSDYGTTQVLAVKEITLSGGAVSFGFGVRTQRAEIRNDTKGREVRAMIDVGDGWRERAVEIETAYFAWEIITVSVEGDRIVLSRVLRNSSQASVSFPSRNIRAKVEIFESPF